MAVRRDTVQLNIEFITDESRALAKANVDTKALTRELSKTVRAGGDVADVMRRIEQAGGKVGDIDLTKVAPKQLITRARQLKQVLDQLPASSPRVAKLQQEYKRINDRLATIRQETRGVSAAFGSGKAGLIGRLTGALAVIAGVVGAFRGLFSVISDGVRRAATFEQLNVALSTFLGSAEKASKVIEDLNKFSIATPFEPEQVNRAGKALLAFGIEQEKLIPLLTKVGDVAAGTGKDFNELVLIVGKARAAGRVQGEELNQLAEAGIPIYDELAKVTGRNTNEIRKLGEQGKLSFEDLEAVFTNLTSEGGRFNGLLEKQSKTISGLASTAQGAFAELSRNVGSAFTPLIKSVLPPVIAFINRLTERVAPLAQAFGQTLVRVFTFLGKVFEPLVQSVQRLAAGIGSVSDGTGRFAAIMQTLGATLAFVVNIVSGVITGISRLFSVFSAFGGGSGGLLQRVFVQPLTTAIEFLGQFIAVLNGLVSASRVAFDSIGNIGSIFSNTIGLAFDRIKGLFTDNQAAIDSRKQALANSYAGLGKSIGDAFVKGYEDALGKSKVPVLNPGADAGAGGGLGGGGITRTQDPVQTAADKKAEEEAARIARLRAERALDRAAQSIDGSTLPGSVNRRDQNAQLDAANAQAAKEADALQRARNNDLINEEQFQLAKLELKRNLLEQEQEILRTGNDEEVRIAFEKGEQIKEIEQSIFDKKKDLAERENQLKQEFNEATAEAAESGLEASLEFLGKETAARKAAAAGLKAFQKGQAVISGLNELAQIRLATAAQAASVAAVPGAAIGVYIKGAIQAAAAIARTAATVGKINAAKFARGGTPKFGTFGGRSHASGGTQLYGDDGTHIEVERGETFAIVNKNARGLLSHLSDVNQATGGVAFARGGIALGSAPNTTPVVSSAALAASAAPAPDQTALLARLDTLTEVTATMQTRIRAQVVYTDIETAADDVSTVLSAAEV